MVYPVQTLGWTCGGDGQLAQGIVAWSAASAKGGGRTYPAHPTRRVSQGSRSDACNARHTTRARSRLLPIFPSPRLLLAFSAHPTPCVPRTSPHHLLAFPLRSLWLEPRTMVRVLSLVVLAAVAMAAAVVAPSAATPAAVERSPTGTPVATDAVVSFVAGLRGIEATRQKMDLSVQALVLRALEPVWAAFTSGKLDAKIEAFKAGKMDAYIPTPGQVLEMVNDIANMVRQAVFPAFGLVDDLKAGKLDAWLESAKKGTLLQFLEDLTDKLQ